MKFKPFLNFPENTYNKAFMINAMIAGISAGLLLEYKDRDPLRLYREEKKGTDKLYNVGITILVGVVVAYVSYWAMRIIAGFGDSTLVV